MKITSIFAILATASALKLKVKESESLSAQYSIDDAILKCKTDVEARLRANWPKGADGLP